MLNSEEHTLCREMLIVIMVVTTFAGDVTNMKTIQVSEETHNELLEIKLEFSVEQGKDESIDDVIKALFELWRRRLFNVEPCPTCGADVFLSQDRKTAYCAACQKEIPAVRQIRKS